MKMNRAQLAVFAVYFAVLAALISAGLYIVRREFDLYQQIALASILVGLALAIFLNPERARQIFTGRQARYASNSIIMALAFLGILIVINFLVYKNPVHWDLTSDQQHTLSKETVQLLKDLKEPVSVTAFFSSQYPADSTDSARKLLESYQYSSNGQFDYSFVDPVQDPMAAQNARVTRDGTIVLQSQGRQEQITYADEQEITAALIKLANPGERNVLFVTGHGEYALDGKGDFPYATVKSTLENKNYTVNPVNLVANPSIPSDVRAVVIAGARSPLSQQEVASIKEYLDQGGSLVVLAEPVATTDFGDQKDPVAELLSSAWGLTLENNVVIDPQVNPPYIVAADTSAYGAHPITQKLAQLITVFPTARSIQVNSQVDGINSSVLIKTYDSAWGETDLAALNNNEVQFDQKDSAGPLTIAAASISQKTNARVVVIGDSDFASDSNFTQYANGDVLINAIDWASEQESMISITPRQTTQRIMLSPQQYSMNLILLIVLLTPTVILISGISTWVQRRRKG